MEIKNQNPPRDMAEALARARQLLSEEDIVLLKTKPLEEAIWSLHLTFGHQLRSDLELWRDDAVELFKDITEKMPERPALDADSAAGALVAALWHEING